MAEKDDLIMEEDNSVEMELKKDLVKEPLQGEDDLLSGPSSQAQPAQFEGEGTEDANDGITDAIDDAATNDTNSDTIEASPIPSVKSLCSGDFEEPLTPITDLSMSSKSETSRSLTGSGRITPSSQSDQSVSMSSSEKSTPKRKRKSTESAGRHIDFDGQQGILPVSSRCVRFPFRAGIQWKKGEKLEAMDYMHKWFPAKIREINSKKLSVLIHFDGWNQRFDEWVEMGSDRIRPLIRHSERKDRGKRLRADYKLGDQVYAKWTDCKMYPAKITAVTASGSYEVIFYDGFKKQVQPINLRQMPGELQSKTFEVNPEPEEVSKKTKIKKEFIGSSSTVTSSSTISPSGSLDHIEISTPEVQSDLSKPKSDEKRRSTEKSDEKKRSSEKGSGEKKSARFKGKKGKIIPAALFKRRSTEGEEVRTPAIPKLEPAATQTAYPDKLELTVDEIKTEPVTPSSVDYFVDPSPQVTMAPSTSTVPAPSFGPKVLPPKAFVVESDHNRYKCHFEGCNKGFRKEPLLEYHIKYYHIDGAAAPPTPQPSKKRRKTTSFTDSESTASGKRSTFKQRRHLSAESSVPILDVKLEVKEEVDESTSASQSTVPETGEISTQTTPVKSSDHGTLEETYQLIKDELGTKHQRSQSQDSNWTEESSVTDLEGEDSLKADELVNCICDFYEENGLMIQCEVCMCWQHAGCFGITERTLPKTYICFVCENPPGVRESSKHVHEQDWLKSGDIPTFTYLQGQPVSEERRNIIKATNSLVTDLHRLNTVLHSLKLQLKILRTKDEQKIKMWRMDWDVMEPFDDVVEEREENILHDGGLLMGDNTDDIKTATSLDIGDVHVTNILEKEVKREHDVDIKIEPVDFSKMESNVDIKKEINVSLTAESSEGKATETGETAGIPCPTGSDKDQVNIMYGADKQIKDESLTRTTEETVQLTDKNIGANTTDGKIMDIIGKEPMDVTESTDDLNSSCEQFKKDETSEQKASLEADLEEANHSDSTESAVEDPLEMCEKNLLNHIFRIQEEVNNRMDQIEEQVILLEAVEAAQNNKEPPAAQNIMSDLPQLKRCMKMMHDDLNKVKKMSVFH